MIKEWGLAISNEWQTVREITQGTFPQDWERRSAGEFVRRQLARLVAADLVETDKSRRYRLRRIQVGGWEQE